MSESTGSGTPQFRSFVPAESTMQEATVRALVVGLVMCVVLGAANAYLGLKAGMTIAATYPAAVIGMAVLKLFKGTILEENYARTIGSIGESVAAGCIFTIPAFFIAKVWVGPDGQAQFWSWSHYFEASAIMLVGAMIGIFFVTVLRRVMVEDKDLPFPESVAASEIHKAGRSGGTGAKFLFLAMGLGAVIQALKSLQFFAEKAEWFIRFKASQLTFAKGAATATTSTGGGALISTPGVSPAYMGVGYIIGPTLAALNFTGGLLAWGLFVPLLLFFAGPSLEPQLTASLQAAGKYVDAEHTSIQMANLMWGKVRLVAIGGMLMSAAFTLYRMRKSLASGLGRAISDVKKAASATGTVSRTEKDLNFKFVMLGIGGCAVATFGLYYYFTQNVVAAAVATLVMIVAGFFFAAVSGNLVGLIGSSNNPISGLTLSTLVLAALLMVALGVTGNAGVFAVLGVAAVVCVAAAVAGEMLQDLKVGHILGGTPWRMQTGDMIGVVIASLVMFFPLVILHEGDIKLGGTGLGGNNLSAPQAGLMATLSQGIVGGDMAWPLIIVGVLMAIGFILVKVRSPMLVCVGMYLPLETSFAIFIGGLVKGLLEMRSKKAGFNDAQKARVENNGVLLASGLIAGEALIGLLFAGMAVGDVKFDQWLPSASSMFPLSFGVSSMVFVVIALLLVLVPMKNAGRPEDPAPPSAMM